MTGSAGPSTNRDTAERGDLVSGLASALFGAAVLLYVRGFPQLPDGAPGPALFPGIIGGLFVLFGLILVFRYVRDRKVPVRRQGMDGSDGEQFQSILTEPISPRAAWINALSVLGSIVFYLVVVDVLGFSLTMGILLVALMRRLGAGLRIAVGSAVVTTIVIYLLFQRLLLVPLPAGLLG